MLISNYLRLQQPISYCFFAHLAFWGSLARLISICFVGKCVIISFTFNAALLLAVTDTISPSLMPKARGDLPQRHRIISDL